MAAMVGFTAVSCDLDMLPLNEVVLENFWKEKADVQSVVNSCYVGMQEGGYVEKIITWGELRSDNIAEGPDVPSGLQQMMKGNLKPTNNACDWGALYTVINRCNTVIYYAPQVAAKDPNYTESDLRINLAEAKALRALSFFYLIRTFKDVPFSLDPSIDDFQDYRVPATKHEVILDSLIGDLEACKEDAPRKYADANGANRNNTGRITRNAIYALLADMYLWKGSDYNLPVAQQQEAYRKCVEYCDMILDYKYDQYEVDEDEVWKSVVELYNGYPLLAEQKKGAGQEAPNAFNAIFGRGNSFESIFELTYGQTESDVKNTDVAYMYGGNDNNGTAIQYVKANKNLLLKEITGTTYTDTELFPVTSDYRSLTSFRFVSGSDHDITKYVVSSFTQGDYGTLGTWEAGPNTVMTRSYTGSYEGWIIYRLSEIMLMRAEAELQMAKYLADQVTPEEEEEETPAEPTEAKTRTSGASLATAEELYKDAVDLITAVYMRSNPTGTAPTFTTYEYDALMTFLENERQREFLFEGKRYYDLVRRARREGNNDHFVAAIRNKFEEASQAVMIKMAMPDFVYMPYAEYQCDVNPNLVQNPAYAEEDELVKN